MRSFADFIKVDSGEGLATEFRGAEPSINRVLQSRRCSKVSLLATDREIRQIKKAAVARTPASIRAVAQLGRAFASGAKGRRFESCQPDKSPRHSAWGLSGSM